MQAQRKQVVTAASEAPVTRDPLLQGVIFQRPGHPRLGTIVQAVRRIQELQRGISKGQCGDEGSMAPSCETAMDLSSGTGTGGEDAVDLVSLCKKATSLAFDPSSELLSAAQISLLLRALRVAPEHTVKDPSHLRVCNSCGVAWFWKLTEQHWLPFGDLHEHTWWLGTIWEKEHLVDKNGTPHSDNVHGRRASWHLSLIHI